MPKSKSRAAGKLTHIDKEGKATMVDVSSKSSTQREAVASASVHMKKDTLKLITSNNIAKGNVFETARLAGIMAAKKKPFEEIALGSLGINTPVSLYSGFALPPTRSGHTTFVESAADLAQKLHQVAKVL